MTAGGTALLTCWNNYVHGIFYKVGKGLISFGPVKVFFIDEDTILLQSQYCVVTPEYQPTTVEKIAVCSIFTVLADNIYTQFKESVKYENKREEHQNYKSQYQDIVHIRVHIHIHALINKHVKLALCNVTGSLKSDMIRRSPVSEAIVT